MNDPHVRLLKYLLETSPEVSFRDPPPVTKDCTSFTLELKDGVLFCNLKTHFPTVPEARACVEPFLDSWVLDVALRQGRREIEFRYADAEVIDRGASPGATHHLQVTLDAVVVSTATASLHVVRGEYPSPPSSFRTSPDVLTLWGRYERSMRGEEPLLSMAYFNLTVLEAIAGGRKEAAGRFGIDSAVLSTLGDLTANRGDHETARKMPRTGGVVPLSAAENRWLEAVIPKVIRQVGESESGHPIQRLTMGDLPRLDG